MLNGEDELVSADWVLETPVQLSASSSTPHHCPAVLETVIAKPQAHLVTRDLIA